MAYREQIMSALFNLTRTAYAFKTFTRRLKLLGTSKEYPALCVTMATEQFAPRPARAQPPTQMIDAQIWVYADGGKNPDDTPESAVNDALDAIEQALKPSVMSGVQTLDLPDLVSHCWIEGTIERYPGALDGVAKAIVPIKIKVLK